ncbi:sigma-70 family RNA polymerase sigma factor [Flavihumibacter rivuli]|uniref:RNA polymerase sigma factor n=1 Tax=Flavihumibacter rivuli TaxID=2838156 RepID=UPI001BDEEA9B|nr:sigma-70 family RNA polymerase sigma factor [Flavihumibacter rivuli]ULQ56074.1 sigma-70 family RNA polymerase sigma factor [Flavihumibacter rivuli]
MSEKEFLQQIKANQGIIYKVVSLYAADPEEKKDLYQEIILQCWKGWEGFRGEAKFSTWLYRIALNTVLTTKRKQSIIYYQDDLPDHEGNDPALEKEDVQMLRMAIRLLTDIDKALVSLYLEGYSNQEIANIMGITPNSAGVKLHRIRQRLANILNATNHD